MSQFTFYVILNTPQYGNVFLNIWLILTMLEQLGRGQCSTQRPTSCLSQQHWQRYFQYLTCISFCMGGNPRKYCENMSVSQTWVDLRQGDSVPWNLIYLFNNLETACMLCREWCIFELSHELQMKWCGFKGFQNISQVVCYMQINCILLYQVLCVA